MGGAFLDFPVGEVARRRGREKLRGVRSEPRFGICGGFKREELRFCAHVLSELLLCSGVVWSSLECTQKPLGRSVLKNVGIRLGRRMQYQKGSRTIINGD
jgi:hypothetical protein